MKMKKTKELLAQLERAYNVAPVEATADDIIDDVISKNYRGSWRERDADFRETCREILKERYNY